MFNFNMSRVKPGDLIRARGYNEQAEKIEALSAIGPSTGMEGFFSTAFRLWHSGAGGSGGTIALKTAVILNEYDDYLKCGPFDFTTSVPQIYDQNLGRLFVSGASLLSGIITFTTIQPHGLKVGGKITVEDVHPDAYNGTYTVLTVVDAFNFTVASVGTPGAYVGCGLIIDESKTFFVVKPYLLQRSPWDGSLVLMPNGDYHFYEYQDSADSAVVAAGGTGYAVNDILTVSGGTVNTDGEAAQFIVTSVSSGVVTAVTLETAGLYDAAPSNQAATTGGGGTGCTLTVTYIARQRTDTIVVPELDGACNFLLDGGGNYLFSSEQAPVTETIQPPYFTGDIILLDGGPTGVIDENGKPIEWTDANNGGREWEAAETSLLNISVSSVTVTSGTQPGNVQAYNAITDSWTIGVAIRVKQVNSRVLPTTRKFLGLLSGPDANGVMVYTTTDC